MNTLMVRTGRGRYVAASKLDILQHAAQLVMAEVPRDVALESPGITKTYISRALAGRDSEVFCMLTLDNRHRMIRFRELFAGTIDGASVHPREVVKAAFEDNAAAVILCHNHPSGVAEPSQADELITYRLRDALGLLDIRVLDHFVVGISNTVSFAERGLL